MAPETVPIEKMRELIGRRFPGGTFTIERWENAMLHDVCELAPLPGGLAHPIYLFHAPLAGIGLTYSDIFALCHAESPEAVRAGEYEWELFEPLREEHSYRMEGGFVDVERKAGKRGGLMDVVTFSIDAVDSETGTTAARVTNSWIFLRSTAAAVAHNG